MALKRKFFVPVPGFCCLILFMLFWLIEIGYGQPKFENITTKAGITHSYGIDISGGGVSFVDFDQDGYDDLTFATASGENIHFYKNIGGKFTKIDIPTILNYQGTKQLLWADYDNDGDQDLYVSSSSYNRLYQNQGDLNFIDVTISSGMSLLDQLSFGCAWGDYNLDGYLDLYVTHKTGDEAVNELYQNQGDGTFVEVALQAGVTDPGKKPFCAGFVDINNDLWPDLYIAQDRKAINTLFRNNGDGTFSDISISSGADLEMDGMSVTIGDYDGNGYMDIYITNIEEGNRLLKNNGDETFTEVSEETGTGFYSISWGSNFLDYDHDMDLDLYVSSQNASPRDLSSVFYENEGGVFFVPETIGFNGDTAISFSNAIGDMDKDGFFEIAVNNYFDGPSTIWESTGNDLHWIGISLTGILSNRDGIGSRVEVYANSIKQVFYTQIGSSYLGQNSKNIVAGLAENTAVDSIKVYWPSGTIDLLKDVSADQYIEVFEGSTAEIPMIYVPTTWLCGQDSIKLDAGFHDSYLWNTGHESRFLMVKSPGDFFVITTDNEITNQSSMVTISSGDLTELEIEKSDVLCGGTSEGSIAIVNPPENLTYFWSNGIQGTQINNLDPGEYKLTAIGTNRCLTKTSFVIQSPPILTVAISRVGSSQLEAKVEGGVLPYQYHWNDKNFQTSSIANDLAPGNYTVFITDGNGCEATANFKLERITGLDPINMEYSRAFPVPASHYLYISHPLVNLADLTIYNQLGQRVMKNFEVEAVAGDQLQINLTTFEDGIYYLRLVSEAGIINYKFMIKR